MRKIKQDELINSGCFVREPVDKIVREIKESDSDRIILTGGDNVGKSTVLCELQSKGLGTDNQTICANLESIISFSKEPNVMFNKGFFEHYYELIFSNCLLNYVKRNYELTHDTYFKNERKKVNRLLDDTYTNINDVMFKDMKIKEILTRKELSEKILKKMKEVLEIEKCNIAFDRFDWINGSSEYVQKYLSNYFDMFDKAIITSDDPTLSHKKLEGYEIKNIDYGKNKEILRQIIKKRIEAFNAQNGNKLELMYVELYISDYVMNVLEKSNGDIDLAIDTLFELNTLLNWRGSGDLTDMAQEALRNRENQKLELKRIIKNPELHL